MVLQHTCPFTHPAACYVLRIRDGSFETEQLSDQNNETQSHNKWFIYDPFINSTFCSRALERPKGEKKTIFRSHKMQLLGHKTQLVSIFA